MSASNKLYAGEVSSMSENEECLILDINLSTILFFLVQKKKGMFHHSSFLAGGATLAAGRLVAEHGKLKVRCKNTITS